MSAFSRRVLAAVGAALLCAAAASAATLSGTVRNATTGAPAAGVDVVLISLQTGMDSLASTRTDAAGRFRFEHASIGTTPLLVRVVYRGVNYHQNVSPGQGSVNLEVFETSADMRAIEVASRMIVFQPDGPTLLVGEEFSIHNHTQPPVTLSSNDGTFEFSIPEGAQLAQVSAWGQAGMPLTQGTIDKAPNRFALAFALRPGENGVRLSYSLPYPEDRATLRLSSPYAARRVLIIAPPTMLIQGEGFAPAGAESGWNVYARDTVAAGAAIQVSVSGTAPPPSAEGALGPEGGGARMGRMPGRLEDLRWVIIGGFALLFALGVVFLMRRPAGVPQQQAAVPERGPEQPASRRLEVPRTAAPSGAGGDIVAGVLAEAEREARQALEAVKETLFRLELRRQSGALSEEEYRRERARAEQQLRELVGG